MNATFASYQARLATFAAAATNTKTKRTSGRAKKTAPKNKFVWSLSSPSVEDLAFAGFVWRPTAASPDNVQCFNCNCQLDGWEDEDVPIHEHLTHSPNCGFAIVTNIRWRNGDVTRKEEDPTTDRLVAARRETFGNAWPLDASAGYPSVEQMVAAGWIYDPTEGNPDGATCPYCALSLDAWDAGDDPLEEHRRRSTDCLFFILSELHKPAPPPNKAKRTSTKPKRASTRSSSASTTVKKSTRGKKRGSESIEEPEYSGIAQSTQLEEPAPVEDPIAPAEPTQPAEPVQSVKAAKPARRGRPASKRLRSSSIASFPEGLSANTPKKTPIAVREIGSPGFEMSSLPASLLVGTPKKTPPRQTESDSPATMVPWKATDIEAMLSHQTDALGFMNDVLIDAGLDDITAAGASPTHLYTSVMAGLTDQEKGMTVEQWVRFNAKRGAEKLRFACERQITAFEVESKRALTTLESIPTC